MTANLHPQKPRSESRDALLRLPGVLAKVPVSRSAWWQGVKEGRYPAAVKLGPRTTAWRESDIDALIQSLTKQAPEVHG